jgi:hypothetical protein
MLICSPTRLCNNQPPSIVLWRVEGRPTLVCMQYQACSLRCPAGPPGPSHPAQQLPRSSPPCAGGSMRRAAHLPAGARAWRSPRAASVARRPAIPSQRSWSPALPTSRSAAGASWPATSPTRPPASAWRPSVRAFFSLPSPPQGSCKYWRVLLLLHLKALSGTSVVVQGHT